MKIVLKKLSSSIDLLTKRLKWMNNGISFHLKTLRNYLVSRFRYTIVCSPYKTIWVNPNNIQKIQTSSEVPYKNGYGGLGQIKDGDWDIKSKTLEKSPKIKGLQQHFLEEKNWERTIYYERLSKRHDDNKIDRKLKNVENLYNSIENNGYIPGKSNNFHHREQLDNLIAVGRSGEIILLDGYHRFVIAKALDIKIAAQVVRRHEQWQKLRDSIYKNGLSVESEELRNHPDLQDILD